MDTKVIRTFLHNEDFDLNDTKIRITRNIEIDYDDEVKQQPFNYKLKIN